MSRDWPIVVGGTSRQSATRSPRFPGRSGPIILHELKEPVTRFTRPERRRGWSGLDLLLVPFEAAAIAIVLAVAYLAATLPDPSVLEASLGTAGAAAARSSLESTPVRLSQIPSELRDSVVKVEGQTFLRPTGIDLLQLLRILSGTSQAAQLHATIAERLAGSLLPKRPLGEADLIRQWMLALRLELSYSQPQLIEIYLNRADFGDGVVGIESAAHRYFDADVGSLTRAQSRKLAVLVELPGQADPGAEHRRS